MADKIEETEEFVTIGEFPELMEAEMARLRLQSAGIETFLSGENSAPLAPGMGPLELQVKRGDQADAVAILEDIGDPTPQEPTTEPDVS